MNAEARKDSQIDEYKKLQQEKWAREQQPSVTGSASEGISV